jgi:hypothetical protein
VCAFNDERGRYNCCFEHRHQCDSDSECCSGACNNGRCGPPQVTCGQVDDPCNPPVIIDGGPARAIPAGRGSRPGFGNRKGTVGSRGALAVTDPTLPECCAGLTCQFGDVYSCQVCKVASETCFSPAECCPGTTCGSQFLRQPAGATAAKTVGAVPAEVFDLTCVPCGGSGQPCCGDYYSGTCGGGLNCCFGQCLAPQDCLGR